jgi:hypothetical protein
LTDRPVEIEITWQRNQFDHGDFVTMVAEDCSAAVSADGLALFSAAQAAVGVDQEAAAAGEFVGLHGHDAHGRFLSRQEVRQVGDE